MKAVIAALVLIGMSMEASAITVDIDTQLTGVPVANNTTVATLELHQNGINVDFSLTNQVGNLNLTGAFISELLFSYSGSTVLTQSSFSNFGGTQPLSTSSFHVNPNGKDAGYDFFLDLNFPTSNNGDRFTNGETVTWTIGNVAIGDFDNLVTGSGASALALIHAQGTTEGSFKFIGTQEVEINPTAVVPEPSLIALMGIGLFGLGFIRNKVLN